MKKAFAYGLALATAAVSQSAGAYNATVDGNASEWQLSRGSKHDNGGLIARSAAIGEYVWRDVAADARTDVASPENIADITGVHITSSTTGIYFLVQLGGLPSGGQQPVQLQIAIDTDRVASSGQAFLAAFADTQVSSAAAWEFLVRTSFGSGGQAELLNTSFSSVQSLSAAQDTGGVEIFVPWTALNMVSPPAAPLRFTIASFRSDSSDVSVDIGGAAVSNALDAVTDYGNPAATSYPNSWDELSDGVVDYHFDVSFDGSGEVYAPIVIQSYASNPSASGEWIAIRNVSPAAVDLSGFKLGDEEDPDAGEGMKLLPTATLASGQAHVSAIDGALYQTAFGALPDAEQTDSSSAPNLANFGAWATGSINLSNSGDQILLLDGSNTVVDVVGYASTGAYAGITVSTPAPATDVVLSRNAQSADTDDCSADFSSALTLCTASTNCGSCNTCLANLCQPQPDGTGCNDGDVCTTGDTCSSGSCGGTPRNCSNLDGACSAGVCNATSGVCEAQPANDGGGCDDSDPCTTGDVCSAGNCGGAPKDCSNQDSACSDGVCNAASGACEAQPVNNGGNCDDNDPCTSGDTCSAGSCGGTPKDCSALDGVCTAGSCNSSSGACEALPANSGQACNDGDACTTADVCSAGACSGTGKDCSAFDGACSVGSCNTSSGACEAQPANNGAPCDDGDACTVGDSCGGGSCGGSAKDCSNLNTTCSVGNCNPTTGACEGFPANGGGACDDNSACTSGDTCQSGACIGTPNGAGTGCGDACNTGVCVPATGGCMKVPVTNGTGCDDGRECTSNDSCQAGVCSGLPTPGGAACGSECAPGLCDATTGQCNSVQAPDGTPCSGGSCSGGSCIANTDGGVDGSAGMAGAAGVAGMSGAAGAAGAGGMGGIGGSAGAAGSGGTAGSGGAAGAAGMSGGAGTAGAAGSGGTGGSAGAAGSAGTAGASGGAGGASAGSGGSAGLGGAGSGGLDAGVDGGGVLPGDGAAEGGGCGCRASGSERSPAVFMVLGLGLVLIVSRRRRLAG